MAIRFRGFISYRDAEVPLGLKNDLRELERYLTSLDERVAGLDGSEPLGVSPPPHGGGSGSTQRPHAFTHSRGMSDPLQPHQFTWENDHLFQLTYTNAVANSRVPVTIRKIDGQTTDLFLVQDDELNSIFTVDDEGRAAIQQQGATLNAWLNVKNTGISEGYIAALSPVIWVDANDPEGDGTVPADITDETAVNDFNSGYMVDKGSHGANIESTNSGTNMPIWYKTLAAASAGPGGTAPDALPNSKPFLSTYPGDVGTQQFTAWNGGDWTIYAVYYQDGTPRKPLGSKCPSNAGEFASIIAAQSKDDTPSETGLIQMEKNGLTYWQFLGTSSGLNEWVWGKWTSTGVMEIDGVDMPPYATSGSPSSSNLNLEMWFTNFINSGSYQPDDGFFAEVLVFDRVLTPTEQSNVEWYLEDKWNVNGGATGGAASGPYAHLIDTANTVVTEFDELGHLHIGGENPASPLHITYTTEQARFGYDATNYASLTVDVDGNLDFDLTGTTPEFTFNNEVNIVSLTAPQFHVEYDSDSFVDISVTTNTGSLDFGDAADSDIGKILYYHAFDAMEIYCGAVDVMWWQSTYVSANVPILAFGDVYWDSLTTGSRITSDVNGLYIEPDIASDGKELYVLSGTSITSKNASVPVLYLDGEPLGQANIIEVVDENDLEVFRLSALGQFYGYDGELTMAFISQTDDANGGLTPVDAFSFDSSGSSTLGKHTIWSNTASGTILDLDQSGNLRKDGSSSSSYMYEGGAWIMEAGSLAFDDNVELRFGSSNDVRYYFNATDMVMDTVTGSAFRMQVNSSDIAVFDASEFDSLVPIIWNKQSTPSTPASNKGVVYLDTADSILKIRHDDGSVVNLENGSVATPFDVYMTEKIRNATDTLHGGLSVISTANTLDSGTPINDTVGLGKIMFDVIAGSVTAGSITITGTSVDRESGVETGSDTDVLTIAGLTTGTGITATDANGEIVADFANAYISSKWFRGAVAITTTDLTITDVDVYQVAFEQHDDQTEFSLDTLDISAYATNATAFVSVHLYSLEVTGSTCTITAEADAVLTTAEIDANKWYRLRRGNIQKTLDGSTDGFWCDLVLGPGASVYWENINAKVWTLSPLSGVVAVGGAGSFSPGTTYDWTSNQNVSDTTEWRFGNSQDLTIQHDGVDNIFTSIIANSATAKGFKFLWDIGAEANADATIVSFHQDDGSVEYNVLDLFPHWDNPWNSRDGHALVLNEQTGLSTDGSFIGIKSDLGTHYGMYKLGNATSLSFYANDAFTFGTIGGGLQVDYKLDYSGGSGTTKSSITTTREGVNTNSSLFYHLNNNDQANAATQLLHTWACRDGGYNTQFMIHTDGSGGGASLPEDGKLRFDTFAACSSNGPTSVTVGDTYFVYDSVGTTLDLFVDATEMMNVDTTATRFLNGLVVPYGTTPGPAEEGAIFVDTDDTAVGVFKMYANGAWRDVGPGGGGSGEVNTASNAGSGTSLYYNKNIYDLEFNGIKSENVLLTVFLDTVTHDIELTVNEGQIDHDALANYDADEHIDWTASSAGSIDATNIPYVDLSPYCVEDTTGGDALNSTTPVQVNLDSETISDANYSLSADTITISNGGKYQISHHVTIDCDPNVSTVRGGWETYLQVEPSGGGGYSKITQSDSCNYNREVSSYTSCGTTCIYNASAGDKIQLMMAHTEAATAAYQTVANYSQVSIIRVG